MPSNHPIRIVADARPTGTGLRRSLACAAAVLMLALIGACGAARAAAQADPPDAHSGAQPRLDRRQAAGADIGDALSGASVSFSSLRAPAGEAERTYPTAEQPARDGDFWIAFEDIGAGEDALRQSLLPLVSALEARHPNRRVVVTRIPSGTFAEEVRRQRIPFVMATSGTMVTLMQNADVVPLASRGADAGALLLVRSDRREATLASLQGGSMAYSEGAVFGPKAWLDAKILHEGLDPSSFWSRTEVRARSVPDVLAPLAAGRVDAALLPGCLWERLAGDGLVDETRFAPVGAAPEPGRCLSSTARYPDWMLGYSPSASNDALRRLAATVFETEGRSVEPGSRWDFRVDLGEVRAAMEALELGPWSHLSEESLRRLFERHKDKAALALVLLLALVLHSLRANHLVRVRTQALTEALQERDRMEDEAKRGRERLSAMERAGILSQMSGMFAHELKQPLAAVRNYVGGLKLREKLGGKPDATTLDVLQAIDDEAARAAGIVERVRSYAKAGSRAHGPTDLVEALRRAVDYARRHDSRCAPVWIVPGGALGADPAGDRPVMVWGDALELELLILNLVRNASQAATTLAEGDPAVRVSLRADGAHAVVTVEDNGPALSDEAFARLTGWGDSIKREGLGIGLSICRGIADRHGAALRFARRAPQGVAASVSIPLWDDAHLNQDAGNGATGKEETNA